jgi:hypothetical protein
MLVVLLPQALQPVVMTWLVIASTLTRNGGVINIAVRFQFIIFVVKKC